MTFVAICMFVLGYLTRRYQMLLIAKVKSLVGEKDEYEESTTRHKSPPGDD